MSKFCKNCGFELDDDAIFCVNCGAAVDEEPSGYKVKDSEIFAQGTAVSNQGQRIGKIIKGIFIAALVIAAVAISANIAIKFTGYRGFLRKVMKAYESYDIDQIVSMAGDMYYYEDEDYTQDYFQRVVGSGLDYFDSHVGHNYKFSYKPQDFYTLSGRREGMVLDRIKSDYPDFDEDTIKKIVVAEVQVTAKKNKRKSTFNLQITMSKEGSKWRLLFID